MRPIRTGDRVFSTETGCLGQVRFAADGIAAVRWEGFDGTTRADVDTLKRAPFLARLAIRFAWLRPDEPPPVVNEVRRLAFDPRYRSSASSAA